MFYRYSSIPWRQWLYFRLWQDGKISQGMTVGLDLGCNRMQNCPVFRTKEYIGIDVDKGSLDRGSKTRPKANPIHAKIESFDAYPNGDFAVCVKVFHLKYKFDVPNTVPILMGLVGKINAGGALLINFGKSNMPYMDEIRAILRSSFHEVEEITPPFLGWDNVGPLSPILAAGALYCGQKGDGGRIRYFRCVGRV